MAPDPEAGKSAVWLQWFKEVVTAVLGIGIVVYTLVMTQHHGLKAMPVPMRL